MAKKSIAERIGEMVNDPSQRRQLEVALASHGLTLGTTAPIEPTDAMIAASMAAVNGRMSPVDKREKHRLRLRAALTVLHMKSGAL